MPAIFMNLVILIALVFAVPAAAAAVAAQAVPAPVDPSPKYDAARARDPQALQQQRRAAVRDALAGKTQSTESAPAGSRKLSAQERIELRRQLRQQQHQLAP